jgi:exodeoxyribonuclease-1
VKNPKTTFFFYDLETSGLSARTDRIMQFAGQRTDMDLNSIGEPVNLLIKMTDDILPSPEALLVTGITPQQTVNDGISEAEFARIFADEIATPGTIMTGYNSVRFDDEFMRHTLWRNFYDPYEWQWKDGRSRWDLLDVVRMVRALRPDGIEWPVVDGKATNRLEILAKWNKLEHTHAHDALSDVEALISVGKLLREKQPKMWDYLLKIRDKKEVANLVNLDNPTPFVYTSGRYNTEFEKTTVALPVAPGKNPGSVLVYDLRFNPDDFANLDQKTIAKTINASWEERKKDDFAPIPVKELQYNRCPAVAPLGVLDADAQKRLDLNLDKIQENFDKLRKNRGLVDKIAAVWAERSDFARADDVESQLYDSFMPDADKARVSVIRNATAEDLADFHPGFTDERLPELLFRYKARNFPKSLSESEQKKWEEYRAAKFAREIPKFLESLARVAKNPASDQFVLQELQLWVESIAPADD